MQLQRRQTMNSRQTIINLGYTIEGEINRICVTDNLEELNNMYSYAKRNLERLINIRYMELRNKETNNDRDNNT